nr:hypothetical protein [Rhodococcus erythropolis]
MYALADGHHLYPTPDGVWHYLTPDENAVTIGAPAEALAELDNFLRRSGSVLGAGAIEIADALVSRGVLAVPGQVPEIPGPQRVLMDGIGPVADACIALLSKALPDLEVVSTTAPIEDDVASSDLVLSVADAPPHDAWSELDTWCRHSRTPWQRVHAELGEICIGPFFDGIDSASYRDVCGRRLSASRVPDHLLALWNHLADSERRPLGLSPTAAAMVSALACSDVVASSYGAPPSHLHHQIRMNPRTLMMTRHPVLPLPGGVLEPSPTLR